MLKIIQNELKNRINAQDFSNPELLQLYSIQTLFEHKMNRNDTLKEIEIVKEQGKILQSLINLEYIDGKEVISPLLPEIKTQEEI